MGAQVVILLLVTLFESEPVFCSSQRLVRLHPISLQEDASAFRLIYGNTLAKEIPSDKPGLNGRISEYLHKLFEGDLGSVCNISDCSLPEPFHLSRISRSALFLTVDGVRPLRVQMYWINSSGKRVHQNRVISNGVINQFTVTLTCSQESHTVDITLVDRDSSFYLYILNSLHVRSTRTVSHPSQSLLLTILTFNIWNMNSRDRTQASYSRRLELIISEIERLEPDVIGLQEVRYDSRVKHGLSPNQAEHLLRRLPQYNFVYQPANLDMSVDLTADRVEEGLAVLSRYPITNWSYILLPSNTSLDVHQRMCLHAQIASPLSSRLHVFVTHLSLSQELRLQSVGDIVRFVSSFEGEKLLMGDMNAEPASREMLAVRESGMEDAWLMFHPEPDVRTSELVDGREDKFIGLTFDATESYLRKRIDYIYLNQSLLLYANSAELFGPDTAPYRSLSDHLGVLLSLSYETSVRPSGRLKEEL